MEIQQQNKASETDTDPIHVRRRRPTCTSTRCDLLLAQKDLNGEKTSHLF